MNCGLGISHNPKGSRVSSVLTFAIGWLAWNPGGSEDLLK
jgi:hypothetical protein